tara:strand:- start:198 stop:560 length:363 start_codon:yes stop_codon:yes gene_type:complete
MTVTPLHKLRARLEDERKRLYTHNEDEWLCHIHNVLDEMVLLVEDVDRQLTGKTIPRHQYTERVRSMLEGHAWLWHLADGGWSRVTIQMTPRSRPIMVIDRGLSRKPVIGAWDEANGGKQ